MTNIHGYTKIIDDNNALYQNPNATWAISRWWNKSAYDLTKLKVSHLNSITLPQAQEITLAIKKKIYKIEELKIKAKQWWRNPFSAFKVLIWNKEYDAQRNTLANIDNMIQGHIKALEATASPIISTARSQPKTAPPIPAPPPTTVVTSPQTTTVAPPHDSPLPPTPAPPPTAPTPPPAALKESGPLPTDISNLSAPVKQLVTAFNQITTHWETMDYQQVVQFKRQLKAHLQTASISPAEQAILKTMQTRFKAFIDADAVFSLMKELGKALKNLDAQREKDRKQCAENKNLAPKTDRELLTTAEYDLIQRFHTFIQGINVTDAKIRRIAIKSHIWDIYRESHDAYRTVQHHEITWIHGSRSSALPIMKLYQRMKKTGTPALVPTGILLQHNLAPLSGELCNGINSFVGVNRDALSGVDRYHFETAESYARGGKTGITSFFAASGGFAFKAHTEKKWVQHFVEQPVRQTMTTGLNRLKIAVIRLLQMQSIGREELKKQVREIQQKIHNAKLPPQSDWLLHGGYIGEAPSADIPRRHLQPDERLHEGQLVIIPSPNIHGNYRTPTYGVVSYYDESTKSYCVTSEKEMGSCSTSFISEDQIELPTATLPPRPLPQAPEEMYLVEKSIDDIMSIIDTVQPLPQEELPLINDAFPIVWASCSPNLKFTYKSGTLRGEVLVQQKALALGYDLHIAFTDKDHVQKLKEQIGQYDVAVMSFEARELLMLLGRI